MMEIHPEITVENFEILAAKYRPLILKIIREVHRSYGQHCTLEFEDLYQEALLTLYRAINTFDVTRGIYFTVYFPVVLRNGLRCYARDYLPHKYIKDETKSTVYQAKFKWQPIDVDSFDTDH